MMPVVSNVKYVGLTSDKATDVQPLREVSHGILCAEVAEVEEGTEERVLVSSQAEVGADTKHGRIGDTALVEELVVSLYLC